MKTEVKNMIRWWKKDGGFFDEKLYKKYMKQKKEYKK
jgi:hypothetical protein